MEGLVLNGRVDPAFWSGRRVLLTGHTGFKGSWLSIWLGSMGAEVTGLALAPPTQPSLFDVARVAETMRSHIGDVRDLPWLAEMVGDTSPEVVIHMAAQPLVRASYDDPVGTYATNVMGTVNVLEAVRQSGSARVVVNVTTDKCYENREWPWGYREDEALGGYDPYSSSKGCSELVTSAYRQSFFSAPGSTHVASARAGNVIGGGDWAVDRLVPDTLAAFARDEAVTLRNPGATRPWQHVLEPLSGYLVLAQALWDDSELVGGWNFGPRDEDARPVSWVVERLAQRWPGARQWGSDNSEQPHEATFLKLDTSKARSLLGWQPTWDLHTALDNVVDWHVAWSRGEDARALCLAQIAAYTSPQNGTRT